MSQKNAQFQNKLVIFSSLTSVHIRSNPYRKCQGVKRKMMLFDVKNECNSCDMFKLTFQVINTYKTVQLQPQKAKTIKFTIKKITKKLGMCC